MTEQATTPIVSVRGLVKRYTDTTAVDGVSFDIEEVLLPVGVLVGMAALFFDVGISRLRLE